MHERECKGYISFNRGVNELNRGVNELNRGVNHSVARQGCNLLRAAVTSAVTSQGCCCGNLQIHPLDLGHIRLCDCGSKLQRCWLMRGLIELLASFTCKDMVGYVLRHVGPGKSVIKNGPGLGSREMARLVMGNGK